MPDWFQAILRTLGPAGAVVIALAFIYFNPSDQAKFQQNTLEELRRSQDVQKELSSQLDALKDYKLDLEVQLRDLQNQLEVMQITEDSWPFPAWFKDASGRVLFANKAYETWFLKPRGYSLDDYLYHDDFAVWPKATAEQFRANDQAVMRSRKYQMFNEPIPQPDGSEKPMWFIKYPRMLGPNLVVGVAGRYIPDTSTLEQQ